MFTYLHKTNNKFQQQIFLFQTRNTIPLTITFLKKKNNSNIKLKKPQSWVSQSEFKKKKAISNTLSIASMMTFLFP